MKPKRIPDRRPSGQFDHQNMAKVCVCGRPLAEHLAAYPHPRHDEETGAKVCAKFKAKR